MPKPRTPLSPNVVADVLTRSRRRCCVCFGLDHDSTRKKGQIAHLNHNRSNNSHDNLIFLCLEHHDEFDSRTSQSKGLTVEEVTRYRAALLAHTEQKQFGPVLPADSLKKLKQDLTDLEKATESTKYVDDRVRYLGGHPKHDDISRGTLTLDDELIRFVSTDESMSLLLLRAAVDHIFFETQHLGMEQAEVEEEVLIEDHETLLRFTTVVTVKDPEGVHPEGFNVRFGFRNDYHARLFSKKCADRFGVPPF